MHATPDTHYDFDLRLKRIEASATARTQRLFVGEDESYVVPRRDWSARHAKRSEARRKAFYPVAMLMGVALGAFGHALGMVARFYVEGPADRNANPDLEMVKQLAAGFALATLLGYVLGLRTTRFMGVKLLGAALGVLFFHNAVHLFPEVFANLTSPEWVSQMIAHTKAHTILWRGVSTAF
ncbi:MAG: hypothetical protein ACOH2H_08670 [Cypionkella sp.]